MKNLLIVLLMLTSLLASGQKYELLFSKTDSAFTELSFGKTNIANTEVFRFSRKEQVIKVDTIKVKALCSYDYSYSKDYDELKSEPVFVTYLLQLRAHYYPYHPYYKIYNESLSVEILGYLYENGMQLSKIINVWQYKEITK